MLCSFSASQDCEMDEDELILLSMTRRSFNKFHIFMMEGYQVFPQQLYFHFVFNLWNSSGYFSILKMIIDIVARLESILKLKDILGLQNIATHHSSWRTPSTSLEDRSIIFGRDQDKQAILKLLLHDDDNTAVIPIVGMGGLGKTTLAQFVFNHDSIKHKFDVQAWEKLTGKRFLIVLDDVWTEDYDAWNYGK
ncbi:unnamed protein product [Vicia faba]|uniref:NB-ARC domain-containing protein n=1 Tax=Vicia faba TaxID=3906 RepID=A0AAV0Z402_VICFA|nr:unnamed protein product [Vicia faba]